MSLHLSTISAARACRSVRSLRLLTVILQAENKATRAQQQFCSERARAAVHVLSAEMRRCQHCMG